MANLRTINPCEASTWLFREGLCRLHIPRLCPHSLSPAQGVFQQWQSPPGNWHCPQGLVKRMLTDKTHMRTHTLTHMHTHTYSYTHGTHTHIHTHSAHTQRHAHMGICIDGSQRQAFLESRGHPFTVGLGWEDPFSTYPSLVPTHLLKIWHFVFIWVYCLSQIERQFSRILEGSCLPVPSVCGVEGLCLDGPSPRFLPTPPP